MSPSGQAPGTQPAGDLFRTAPIGIYRSLRDGTIVAANPALVSMLGYRDADELLRVNLRDIYAEPTERDELIRRWETSGARVADHQVRWTRRDGSTFWASMTAHAMREPSGAIAYFQGFIRDITEERDTQERVRLSEARLRTVVEAINEAVWDWDLATDAITWSDGFATLFGTATGEQPDFEAWRSRVHPEDLERVSAGLQAAIGLESGRWQDEYRFRRADGSWAVVLDRGRVLRDETGRPIRMVGAMTDVTEQRSAEAQLRHAQKMEAIGQLTGGIAHDFNNLLTVILANAELLSAAMAPGVDVEAELRDIQAAARRGQVMVSKLLGFARRSALELRVRNLGVLLQEESSMLRRLIPATIDMRLELGPGPHDIMADHGAIEQILLNLATNARDAMPAGGTLRIGVHRTYLFDVPERIEGARPGTYVCLTVEDTGAGLEAETRAHMFEPFFTTKPTDKGTGLGLAMVYGLVRQHDGFIQVTTARGQGTTIRIYLPAARADATEAPAPPARPPSLSHGGELVLVAEDEDEVRLASQRVLERLGYRVIAARDGEGALALYRQYGPEIRLVLSDVVMPRMNGPQLRAAIRQAGGTVPVLFASGYPARDLEAASALDPDTPLLRKPWTVDELALAVRDALASATGAT